MKIQELVNSSLVTIVLLQLKPHHINDFAMLRAAHSNVHLELFWFTGIEAVRKCSIKLKLRIALTY